MSVPLRASCLTLPLLLACSSDPAAQAPAKDGDPDAKSSAGAPPSDDPSPKDPDSANPPEAPETPAELAAIAPAGEHPFSVLDLLEADRVGSPALAPDGSALVYVLRETDLANNSARRSLWMVELAGGEPRRLDAHPKGVGAPQWAPDGRFVYFLSSRSGSSQVWRRPMPEGQAEQVTDLPVEVTSFRVGPKGERLAVTAELFPDCTDLGCTADRLREREAKPETGVGYDRLFVRHWDSWKDGRRSVLLSCAATVGTRDATLLSRSLDADVPSKPFGGSEDYTFAPDGQGLVFSARDAAGGSGEPWSTNFDLYFVPTDGSRPPQRLTENPAWDAQPSFSADGKQLVWLAMERPGYEADRMRLMVQGWDGAAVTDRPRAVTQDWDRSISSFALAEDGQTAFVIAQHIGQRPLFAVDLAGGPSQEPGGKEPRQLIDAGTVSSVTTAGGQISWLANDLSRPAELFAAPVAERLEARQLTRHNDDLMARAQIGEAEQFEFLGAEDHKVYGWLVKPADFRPDQRYPIAFLIHGGPQGSFGNQFHYRWNPQVYAGAGYAAIMIDFHGSTGYGQAFTDAIAGDWGGKPLIDLQRGLEAALERYPWLDGERVCALGASYGGFMINWIAGNWPERFRCLVNHDGVFDQRMMYYATEELWFPEWEHGGPAFEVPEAYARHNPVDHVLRWQTPMLVIHGSLDYRVGIEQGLGAFTALQRRGVESRFLHFPDENHWVLSPANSQQWHNEVLAWLERHLASQP